jgi:hypothetical protein
MYWGGLGTEVRRVNDLGERKWLKKKKKTLY